MKKILAAIFVTICATLAVVGYNYSYAQSSCKAYMVLSGNPPAESGDYNACYHTMVTTFNFDRVEPGGHYVIEVRGTPYRLEFYGWQYPEGHNTIVATTYCPNIAHNQLRMDIITGDLGIRSCVFEASYLPPPPQQ